MSRFATVRSRFPASLSARAIESGQIRGRMVGRIAFRAESVVKSDHWMKDGGVGNGFSTSDATVAVDYDTGDALVYAGGGAASYYRGTWYPGRVFNATSLSSKESRFSAVDDPDEIQQLVDAAHDALVESLKQSGIG